jgi:hypothetical protein
MKNVFGWTIAALFAFTLVAQAQQKDPPKVKVDAPGVRVEATAPAARDANDMRNWRASKIIGANVQGADQKSLGTVNDIIMDSRGKAHYIILAHGGVLGVGQKHFAIPIGAVSFMTNQDETVYARVDIRPEVLDKADGFTSDKWPNFNDATWRKDNDTFYTNAGVKVHVDVDRPIRDR